MNVKTSFFNPTIYKKTLTQNAPICIAYFFILIMSGPVNIAESCKDYKQGGFADWAPTDFVNYIKQTTLITNSSMFLHIIFAAIFGLCIFRYLYNSRQVGSIHALPIRRECLFFTNVLAGVTMFAVPQLLNMIISQIVTVCYGYNIASTLFATFLVSFAICLISFSISVLSSIFCGHTFAMPAIYLFLNFFAVTAELFVKGFYELFTYGYGTSNILTLSWLSPIVKLASTFEERTKLAAYTTENIRILIIYAICAIIILGVSLALYRIRHTERCGDALAFRKSQPVVHVLVAWIISWALVALFSFNQNLIEAELLLDQGARFAFLLKTFLSSAIVYLILKVILERSFRILKTTWSHGLIFAVGSVLLCILLQSDPLGYETNIPEVKDVANVTMDGNNFLYAESEENIQDIITLHQKCLEDKDICLKKRIELHNESYSSVDIDSKEYEILQYITLTYNLKNGKTLIRHYVILDNSERAKTEGTTAKLFHRLESSRTLQLETLKRFIQDPKTQIDGLDAETADTGYSGFNSNVTEDIYNLLLSDLADETSSLKISDLYDEELKEDDIMLHLCYLVDENGNAINANSYNQFDYSYELHDFTCVVTPESKHTYKKLNNILKSGIGYSDSWDKEEADIPEGTSPDEDIPE